jgi:hypothetical protein
LLDFLLFQWMRDNKRPGQQAQHLGFVSNGELMGLDIGVLPAKGDVFRKLNEEENNGGRDGIISYLSYVSYTSLGRSRNSLLLRMACTYMFSFGFHLHSHREFWLPALRIGHRQSLPLHAVD